MDEMRIGFASPCQPATDRQVKLKCRAPEMHRPTKNPPRSRRGPHSIEAKKSETRIPRDTFGTIPMAPSLRVRRVSASVHARYRASKKATHNSSNFILSPPAPKDNFVSKTPNKTKRKFHAPDAPIDRAEQGRKGRLGDKENDIQTAPSELLCGVCFRLLWERERDERKRAHKIEHTHSSFDPFFLDFQPYIGDQVVCSSR